jgi:hypothetical protein
MSDDPSKYCVEQPGDKRNSYIRRRVAELLHVAQLLMCP